jgi:uncharacterized membrane protein
LAAVALATIGLYKHSRYGSNAFDLAIFDQQLRMYSRFELGPNTVKGVENLLGDHFHPALALLTPLYWLWEDVRVLLIAQGGAVALSSLYVFAGARRTLGPSAALGLQLAYVIFWGVSAAIVFDFHEYSLSVLGLSAALYGLVNDRGRHLWSGSILALATREDLALVVIAIGLYAVATGRRRRGSALASAAAAWFVAVIWLVIPSISGSSYGYWRYEALGTGVTDALARLIENPLHPLFLLVNSQVKLETLAALLAAWAFLPLLSPLSVIALPVLAARFWSTNEALWTTKYHYSLLLAPIFAFATIDAIARVERRRSAQTTRLLIGAVAAASVVAFAAVMPLEPLRHLNSSNEATAIRICLEKIPAGPASASVAATANLLPHLSHRRNLYTLFSRRNTSRITYIALQRAKTSRQHTINARALVRARRDGFSVACSNRAVVVMQQRRRHS